MATLSVTLAEFQQITAFVGGPVVYQDGGGTINSAIILSLSGAIGLTFLFTPKPSTAAFLALYPGAIQVEKVAP